MDMKKILQAMDGVSTKPVEGASDMSKFLSIVDNTTKKEETLNEGANPHKVSLPVQMAMQHYQKPKEKKSNGLVGRYFKEAEEAMQQRSDEKKEHLRQYASLIAERVMMKEGWFDDKPKVDWNKRAKELFAKGLTEQQVLEQLIKEGCPPKQAPVYVQAGQLEEHEAGWERHGMAGVGMQQVREMPIAATDDPNDPVIHGHHQANPMSLKGRIMQARAQLKELAQAAESNDLAVWQDICAKAKGGMFMGLEQNLEQIRHGIGELAAKRKKGGTQSRGIDKNIEEVVLPKIKATTPKAIKPKAKTSACRAGQVQTGVQNKDGKVVPKCSVKLK